MAQYNTLNIGFSLFLCCVYLIPTIYAFDSTEGIKSGENLEVATQSTQNPTISRYYQGVQGKPGIDFPVLTTIPKTAFRCRDTETGYYADLETRCQVFHICEDGKKISFLCPNGTIFQQSDLICDWWYKVNCTNSPLLYEESSEQLKEEIIRKKSARRISVKSGGNIKQSLSNQEKVTTEKQYSLDEEYSSTIRPKLSAKPSRNFKEIPNIKNKTSAVNNNNYSQHPKNHLETFNITKQRLEDHHQNILKRSRTAPEMKDKSIVPNYIQNNGYDPYLSEKNDIQPDLRYDKGRNISILNIETDSNILKNASTENNFVNIFVGSKHKVLRPSRKKNSCTTCIKNETSKISGKVDFQSSRTNKLSLDDTQETQIPQETSSFVESSNYNNKVGKNSVNEANDYPNHRKSYYEIRDPNLYRDKHSTRITPVTSQYLTTQSFNKGKTFIGSSIGTIIPKNEVHKLRLHVSTSNNNKPIRKNKVFDNRFANEKQKGDRPSTISFNIANTVSPLSSKENYVTAPTYFSTAINNLETLYSTEITKETAGDESLDYGNTNNINGNEISITSEKQTQAPYTSTYIAELAPDSSSVNIPSTRSKFPALPPRPFEIMSTTSTIFETTQKRLRTTSSDGPFPYPFLKISTASPFSLSLFETEEKQTSTPSPITPYPESSTFMPENMNRMISVLLNMTGVFKRNDSTDSLRPGLIVPPSVSPQTLHTLATYFENALDDIAENKSNDKLKMNNESVDTSMEEKLRSLLSNMTRYGYENLFKDTNASNTDETVTTSMDLDEDLDTDSLEHTSKVRKLAKIFSQALSEYLDNPTNFKNTLHRVRPTEPPIYVNGLNSESELLSFSEDDLKSSLSSLYNNATSWGYILKNKTDVAIDENSNSLGTDLESLSGADSQSFISQFNSLSDEQKQKALQKDNLPNNHWTSSLHATNLWRTTFAIDPYSLNKDFQATESYADVTSTTDSEFDDKVPAIEFPSPTPGTEIKYELRSFPKFGENSSQLHGILIDFMNITTPESNRFNRILRKLNTTEDEFLDRMKKIEQNPLTRRLILLLIHECDLKNSRNNPTLSPLLQFEKEINGDNLNLNQVTSLDNSENHQSKTQDQDRRALQLLNSLYDIATKFGR